MILKKEISPGKWHSARSQSANASQSVMGGMQGIFKSLIYETCPRASFLFRFFTGVVNQIISGLLSVGMKGDVH